MREYWWFYYVIRPSVRPVYPIHYHEYIPPPCCPRAGSIIEDVSAVGSVFSVHHDRKYPRCVDHRRHLHPDIIQSLSSDVQSRRRSLRQTGWRKLRRRLCTSLDKDWIMSGWRWRRWSTQRGYFLSW